MRKYNAMSNIAIVYYSQGGATAMMAHSVAQGVIDAGATAQLFSIEPHQFHDGRWHDELTLDRLAAADAIIFGAPTFAGGVAKQFQGFADATAISPWQESSWRRKVAGGFSVSPMQGADLPDTLHVFETFAAQHGMIWATWDEVSRQSSGGHRGSLPAGLMGTSDDADSAYSLEPVDVIASNLYGRHVAALTARLSGEVLEPPALLARRAREAAERRL